MNSNNWWANKMGGQPAPTNYPAQTPTFQPPTPTPYNPIPQQPAVAQPRLPQSATSSARCPGCGSGNYGNVTPEAKARCYDCGYPLQQSGSGVGKGISQPNGGAPMPARQVSTANNFNPQTIIGRLE